MFPLNRLTHRSEQSESAEVHLLPKAAQRAVRASRIVEMSGRGGWVRGRALAGPEGAVGFFNAAVRGSLVTPRPQSGMVERLSANDRRTYRLFISHSWEYNDAYKRMGELLNDANYFEWHDYSVPVHDPADAADDAELYSELEDQIDPASVVVILAGMYVNDSKWIKNEIEIAEDKEKAILGIEPWGSQRTPSDVSESSDEVVKWSTSSVVGSVRSLSP